MIARDLEELGLLRLSEEQTGEGVVIPYTKYFSKEENVGVKWRKNNKKQELKTSQANSNRKQVCFKTKYRGGVWPVEKNTNDCGKAFISGCLKSPGWMLFQRRAFVKHEFLGSMPGRKYKHSGPVMDRWTD